VPSYERYTDRAKKVLELSLREALQLGHNYIGTEHILLGLIREGEGVAAQVLTELVGDTDAIRKAVIKKLIGDMPAVNSSVEERLATLERLIFGGGDSNAVAH
jgi:ATP-dependent Clp protease ATP-binding subunit ClpA